MSCTICVGSNKSYLDMYNIPGDKGGNWRQNKFIEYAHFSPTICHPTIIEYSKRAHWSESKFLTSAFLHCLFYEELTAISGVDMFGINIEKGIDFWNEHRPHTNPDKLRVVTMRLYPDAIMGWLKLTNGNPANWIHSIQTRKDLRKEITSIKNIGGFSADLFENCVYNAGYNFGTRYPDWKSTPQLAIGMYHILYKDQKAMEIAKGRAVNANDEKILDQGFKILCEETEKIFPNSPPEVWYTKLCSWANLFNGTRYGGYHHDRQLGNLYWHIQNEPEQNKVWDRIFFIRKVLWPERLLGEQGGWNGIRNERKKLWLQKGLTGVEYDCEY